MLEKIYSSGRRNSIIGFLQHSKDQYVAELNQCRDEDEMRHLILKQHKFLTGVILEMFNPIVSDSDVKTLNQIDAAFIDKGDKT